MRLLAPGTSPLSAALLLLLLSGVPASGTAQEKPYPLVFLNTKPDKVPLPPDIVDTLQARHMRNLTRLADEGKLVAAGPFYGGGGIFVFSQVPEDSVHGWLNTDPAILAQRWNIEVVMYQPTVGAICNVGKDYTMTTYGFVRVRNLPPGAEEASMRDVVAAVSPVDTVIAAGAFLGTRGGIVVLRNSPTDSSIAAGWNPSLIRGEIRTAKLYIARGSFCED